MTWAFGHPMEDASGNSIPDSEHARPWRGYDYNKLGELTDTWEQAGEQAEISVGGLLNHRVSGSDVASEARSFNQSHSGSTRAKQWDFERAPDVGDLRKVAAAQGSDVRWEATSPGSAGSREAGHRLDRVNVRGRSLTVGHDDFGRVASVQSGNSTRQLARGPTGRLVAVHEGGSVTEGYLYDASGRMVTRIRGGVVAPAASNRQFGTAVSVAALCASDSGRNLTHLPIYHILVYHIVVMRLGHDQIIRR